MISSSHHEGPEYDSNRVRRCIFGILFIFTLGFMCIAPVLKCIARVLKAACARSRKYRMIFRCRTDWTTNKHMHSKEVKNEKEKEDLHILYALQQELRTKLESKVPKRTKPDETRNI